MQASRSIMSTTLKHRHPWAAGQKGAPTLDSVADILSPTHSPSIERVVLMVGSGVSVAAGLPDFRSPKTGLYANLKKYNLPYPEAIFDIDFFQANPNPFAVFAKELYPGNFKPTITHSFFTLLNDKNKLLRCFTQNVDTLERMAHLPEEKLVEAHGSFATSRCIDCQTEVTDEWMREKVMSGTVAYCEEEKCKKRTKGKGGLVKPDIVCK
jgi:NAD-dependent SIR2 family protein deacetylase